MPRKSAEARALEPLQEPREPLQPPPGLSAPATAVWWRVVLSKPARWFDEGSGPLLATYCELTVQAQAVCEDMAEVEEVTKSYARRRKKPSAVERRYHQLCVRTNEKRLCRIAAALTTLATKLRLSVQATVSSKSARLGDRASPTDRDPLLGGPAVKRTKPH